VSALARLSLRHPRAAAAALLLVTALLAAGLPRLRTDVGYRAFLGPHHPSLAAFDAFLARFGSGLPLAAVWRCDESAPCGSALDRESLEMARDVARALAAEPAVQRVASPATTPLLVPTPFGPLPRRLVEKGKIAADRAALAERALRDPTWVGRLVSADGRTGAVAAQLASSGSDVAVAAYAALDRALAPWEARGFRFARVGGPVEFVVAGGELETATARLVPVMVLLVGATLLALFRSAGAALAVLLPVGVAVAWTLGGLGWLSAFGWAQSSLTQALAPLILVIGVCDGIHVVSHYAAEARGEAGVAERSRLLERVAAEVGAPCFMTSITTAAGFLSFAVADLQSFVRFGLLAAGGVMAALLLSFSALPLLLRHLAPERVPARRATAAWDRALRGLLDFAEVRAGVIAAGAVVVALVCAAGMARLRVDASFEELYGDESRVVEWAHFAARHLRPPDSLEVELDLPEGLALAEPRALAVIQGTAEKLAALPQLGPAHSVVDLLAWTHRLVRGDEPASQRPSARADENAALLGLLSLLSEEGGGLAHWVAGDGRHVRISVDAEKPPQDVLRRVMADVDEILAGLPEGWSGSATGPLAVVHGMIDDIRATQLESFATAAVAVFALLLLFLRSASWALLGLVPTVLPVVVTLGTMGLAGLSLDVGSAMVAAVVLGIAVDDAIHLLERFRGRRRLGVGAWVAMRGALLQVGRAVVTTSLALALGFAALALSPWRSVADFGLVSAVAILTALAAVLVVLPALVLLVRGRPSGPRPGGAGGAAQRRDGPRGLG
jgi:predicted RND superfamily exporter protein